ncbi:UDP-Glc:alpha-D-GlcNAc-diphosphoundecaprenol beta-1,3-glucosyltransferase WfgD [Marinobacter litoralis]|uniref:UDP-Glc:alpha-D-GlcNAc-diphosphoundecaprenol beta-1,3-glucosyltransferase WfgD n=1 Tax=Marinobacter litoralis TaxID=187981 RepID=A0A3M2RLB0_9GAMM|nr:glycosyltransferase [Marinobacter litoralis]RMJ06133.1 UDP-Glc:alpha-D-GlcNAc-diphosphoundecaprenol beta-1,3-glucosyltransferase WfgD [Marinobacter litoralis]
MPSSSNELVSVIIPSYNRAAYIEAAINSALDQTYGPVEVIVVDDGSTDGSYEKIQQWEERGELVLLTHPERRNRGQSASINLGIHQAAGSYIAILDSDDMFAKEKLADQVAFLEANPETGMVYGQGHAVDADGNFLFKVPGDGHQELSDPNRLLLDCYMALPGGSLVRRSVFEKAGLFEESFRAGQDHDMAIRIMEATKCAYLPKLAFYYRKHDDSISVKGLERRWLTGLEILRRANERYPYMRSTIRKRKAVLQFRLGQTYWRERRKAKALPHLISSGLLDPARALMVLIGREQV